MTAISDLATKLRATIYTTDQYYLDGTVVDLSDGYSQDELDTLLSAYESEIEDYNGDGSVDTRDIAKMLEEQFGYQAEGNGNGNGVVPTATTETETVIPDSSDDSNNIVVPGGGTQDYTEGMANNGMCGMSTSGDIFDNNADGVVDDMNGDGAVGGDDDVEIAYGYLDNLYELDSLDGTTDSVIDIDTLVSNGTAVDNGDGTYSVTLSDGATVTFERTTNSDGADAWRMTIEDESGNSMSITNNGDGNIELSLIDQNGMLESVTSQYQEIADKKARWAALLATLLSMMNSSNGDDEEESGEDTASVEVVDAASQTISINGVELKVDDETWSNLTTLNGGTELSDGSTVSITRADLESVGYDYENVPGRETTGSSA